MKKHPKIGFHTAIGGNPTGIGHNYVQPLSSLELEAVIVSADGTTGLSDALATTNDHVLVYRVVKDGSEKYAVPDYSLSPSDAAEKYFNLVSPLIPPEIIKERVHIAIGNELDQDNADWIGKWCVETAKRFNEKGYRVVGPNWASGTPRYDGWETEGMISWLRYLSVNQNNALGLHEYSYESTLVKDYEGKDLPGVNYFIGRYWMPLDICEIQGMPKPNIIITEFGWKSTWVPEPAEAMRNLKNLIEMYPDYPPAAIWYLGSEYNNIADKAQKLIEPTTTFIVNTEIEPSYKGPRVQYSREYWVAPNSYSKEKFLDLCALAFDEKRTVGFSFDDAGIGELNNKKAVLIDMNKSDEFINWYDTHYPGTTIEFEDGVIQTEGPPSKNVRTQYTRVYHRVDGNASFDQYLAVCATAYDQKGTVGFSVDDAMIGNLDDKTMIEYGSQYDKEALESFRDVYYPGTRIVYHSLPNEISLTMPLTGDYRFTSKFNDPRDYNKDGYFESKHEGIDFAPLEHPSYAIASQDGVVSYLGYSEKGYGHYVIVDHGYFNTWYCHLARIDVRKGQVVKQKDILGVVGSSGNSTGTHVHFNLQVPGKGLGGYVISDIVDPTPYVNREIVPNPLVTGDALFGLHATADPILAPGEVELFKSANIELIKVLSNIDPNGLNRLVAETGVKDWIVRAFLSFGGRDISPLQFFNDTVGDVERTLSVLSSYGVFPVVELANEPNLVAEGLVSSWTNGTEFSLWLREVLTLYRRKFPNIKFMFPGLSPGGTISGIRQDSWQFLSQCREIINDLDALGIHVYWSNPNYPIEGAFREVDQYINLFPNKKIYVTESSNNMYDSDETKAQEYIKFWQYLRTKPTIGGVTYFISSSQHYFSDEVWLGTKIPVLVAVRT